MARFGRPRNLVCFYCGKRSGIKFDGEIREFLCLYCDATNYLDENGEITDPPVATEREAPAATQYVLPSSSTLSTSTDSVFCETCLKNQRLFTASIAQYLPDDPSHAEYEELDRNYYKYRRSLEKRYPQVCDDCAGQVQERIRQAGYTAKTDHLRRMMDRSRGRTVTRKKTRLDLVNASGRWLWWGGLLVQLLWHFVNVVPALTPKGNGMRDPDDSSRYTQAIVLLEQIVLRLPPATTLIQVSIAMGVLSAWWNPYFVQVNRGFTRHILGLTQWYSFQGLIVFFRLLFRSICAMDADAARTEAAQLAMHSVTAAVMCFIYLRASRSIRIDMTPLFKTEQQQQQQPQIPSPQVKKSPEKRRAEDSKTFSELFTEALDSTPSRETRTANSSPLQPLFRENRNAMIPSSISDPTLLNSQQQQPQYAEEMDWSPSQPQPQHRALQQTTPRTLNKSFGQSPTQIDGQQQQQQQQQFWYKVPPAPMGPAQRLHNQSHMPILRKKPVAKEDVFFSSAIKRNMEARGEDTQTNVAFKNPSFFAKQENDEANSLADLLGQSFSLSKDDDVSESRPELESNESQTRSFLYAEIICLVVMLAGWVLLPAISAFSAASPYELYIRGSILAVCGAISLNGTRDGSQVAINRSRHTKLSGAILSILSVSELAFTCWLVWELWTGGKRDILGAGSGLLGVMLVHQGWKAVNI